MRKSVTYDAEDIKKILADKHGVSVKDVIKSQYSYTVLLRDDKENDDEGAGRCSEFRDKTCY